ncbi:hypothetical protein IJG90_03675 [Candidatus Saccharibacteria bacterium]|nr:hypothetical protein [Candidatus Saccharibacteria bacterium]
MSNDSKPIKLLIENLPVAASADGHQISINQNTGEADLIFFQISPNEPRDGEINGVAVSHLRLSNNQITRLLEDITRGLDNYKKNK